MPAKTPLLFIGLGGSGAQAIGAFKRLSALLPAAPHLLAIDRGWLRVEGGWNGLEPAEIVPLGNGLADLGGYFNMDWIQDNSDELNSRLNRTFSELRKDTLVDTGTIKPKVIIVSSNVGRTGRMLLPQITQAVRSFFLKGSASVAAWVLGPAIFAAVNPWKADPLPPGFDFQPENFDEIVLFDTDTVATVGANNDVMPIAQELARELPSIRSANRLYVSLDENPAAVEHLGKVNAGLLTNLRAKPWLMNQLDPRVFEELVAELWEQMGYSVTLTPKSRDGGKDIYALHHSDVGDFLYVIECKKYAPDRRVGVEIVRSLYGVALQERATMGIVATTSTFTRACQGISKQGSAPIEPPRLRDARWLAAENKCEVINLRLSKEKESIMSVVNPTSILRLAI